MHRLLPIGALAATVLAANSVCAVTASRAPFGWLPDGTKVDSVILTNGKGLSCTVIAYGATIQTLKVPDRNGVAADIELGYDDLASYVAKPNYWGATIGRFANRIAGAQFILNGRRYDLSRNDRTSSLHGGADGFDKRLWKIGAVTQGESASVVMTLLSPDGDQGYPGELRVSVKYTLDERSSLTIDFEAVTDAPTVVNLTNHSLFNLAGEGSPLGISIHRLTIPASRYTPVDVSLIPTGRLQPVAGTPFDFTNPRTIADGLRDGRNAQIVIGHGYDHNLALDAGLTDAPKLAARLEDPVSGRVMEVLTTEPGIQVYTGNFLDGSLVGKSGHLYRMGDGVALEPQKFPDSPNQPSFESGKVEPGKPYHHTMVLRFTTSLSRIS